MFLWFCQVRRIRRSLDVESIKTLIQVVYCNLVLASAPKKVTDKLQRVQNPASRLITEIQKHERGLSRLLRDDLHWLTIPQRVQYKLVVTVLSVSSVPSSNVPRLQLRANFRSFR